MVEKAPLWVEKISNQHCKVENHYTPVMDENHHQEVKYLSPWNFGVENCSGQE
jgi:hypothetical protein